MKKTYISIQPADTATPYLNHLLITGDCLSDKMEIERTSTMIAISELENAIDYRFTSAHGSSVFGALEPISFNEWLADPESLKDRVRGHLQTKYAIAANDLKIYYIPGEDSIRASYFEVKQSPLVTGGYQHLAGYNLQGPVEFVIAGPLVEAGEIISGTFNATIEAAVKELVELPMFQKKTDDNYRLKDLLHTVLGDRVSAVDFLAMPIGELNGIVGDIATKLRAMHPKCKWWQEQFTPEGLLSQLSRNSDSSHSRFQNGGFSRFQEPLFVYPSYPSVRLVLNDALQLPCSVEEGHELYRHNLARQRLASLALPEVETRIMSGEDFAITVIVSVRED